MEQVKIENAYVEATISALAAEVVSFKAKKDNLERVWCRDPAGWRNCNPILFPISGPLDDGKYTIDNVDYHFGQHGFARDAIFTFTSHTETSATLTLMYSEETLSKYYPFKFRLAVTYTLDGYKLKLDYKLENLDDQLLPFDLGFHPAFNCPLTADESFDDYEIVFPQKENLAVLRSELGVNDHFPARLADIPENTFYYNHTLKSPYCDLTNGKHSMRVSFENFATLGFWHKNPDCKYLCIEPWQPDNELAKSRVFRPSLENMLLEPHSCFTCSYYWEIIK